MHRSSLALLVLGGLSCAAAFSDEPGDKPKRPALGEERGVAVLRRHIPCATCVAFSHDGRTLASGYEDRVVKLWVVTTKRETDTLTGYHSSVGALAFSPDDRMIAGSGGTGDSSIRVWDAKKGKSFQTLKGHTSKVTSVAWSPDGKILGSCLAGPFTSCTLFRPGRVAENPWDFAVRA